MRSDLQWDSYWGSVEASFIDATEKQLDVRFPNSYKEIVSKYNGAFVIDKDAFRLPGDATKSDVVYGLGLMHAFGEDINSRTESMAWALSHRPFGFCEGLLSFARDGAGNLLCFDYREPLDGRGPAIVLWHLDGQPETGAELSHVASNFDAFLDMLFEE